MSTPDPDISRRPAIEALGLTRRYDDHLAVDRVELNIREGEVYGLLGPNGAGKTTLLRMLAGVLKPDAGRALILGRDASVEPLWVKAHLGFLSGDTALYGRLTVQETLDYFGGLLGLRGPTLRARAQAVTEELGLHDFLDQRIHDLSSGQRQRANLARAFLGDPPVLILDEPTVALDVISGAFVREAVKKAKAAGRAVLFSTHIMSEAEELCDRIGLLVRGRIAATGTKESLLLEHGVASLTELILSLHERAG